MLAKGWRHGAEDNTDARSYLSPNNNIVWKLLFCNQRFLTLILTVFTSMSNIRIRD
jgi:hypothetical protein